MTRLIPFAITMLGTVVTAAAAQEHQFPRAEPAAMGMNASMLDAAAKHAEETVPALLSLAVLRRDTLVFEEYFHGGTDTTGYNVKSVSKGFLSALVGIARREGGLPDLDRTVATIFPEHFARRPAPPGLVYRDVTARMDSARRLITLRHLLTMSSGQLWEENGGLMSAFLASGDPVRFALELPMEAEPGRKFAYSTAVTHVLSAVLNRVTGMATEAFAERWLFAPAGIVSKRWDVDLHGVAIGGSEMFFTTRGMLRFGQLYSHRGTLDGREIVPREWVDASLTRQRTDMTANFKKIVPGLDGYGYLWWSRTAGGSEQWCALGHGGQFIVIDRRRELVVAGTSALDARNPGSLEQMQLIWQLLDELVVPAAP